MTFSDTGMLRGSHFQQIPPTGRELSGFDPVYSPSAVSFNARCCSCYGTGHHQPNLQRCLPGNLSLQQKPGSSVRVTRGTANAYMIGFMSWKPVRKYVGIANVFLGENLVDIAEYDLELYEENLDDHAFHAAHSATNVSKVEGTVTGELPIRKNLTLVTEEGNSLSFYLRDSFGSIVCSSPMLDAAGKPVH